MGHDEGGGDAQWNGVDDWVRDHHLKRSSAFKDAGIILEKEALKRQKGRRTQLKLVKGFSLRICLLEVEIKYKISYVVSLIKW